MKNKVIILNEDYEDLNQGTIGMYITDSSNKDTFSVKFWDETRIFNKNIIDKWSVLDG
jgi:hypothetical protein